MDNSHKVIAGTDKGLFIYDHTSWHQIVTPDTNNNLSAQDIVFIDDLGTSEIVVALNGNSPADGLYHGKKVVDPPYYALSLIDSMPIPQSLEYVYGDGGGPIIYIGGGNTICRSIYAWGVGQFGPLQPIVSPPDAFGANNPKCSDLHLFSGDTILYAGGYDMSIDSSAGSLLWMLNDSLSFLKTLDVSALTEDATSDCVFIQMYIGTIDSGIYCSAPQMSHPPITFAQAPNNEKIIDLVTLPIPVAERFMLCAAVNSGIYTHNRITATWTELGNIPEVPNCIYIKLDSSNQYLFSHYVGTEKGLYIFDTLTVSTNHKSKKHKVDQVISIHNGIVTIGLNYCHGKSISIELIDLLGKKIVSFTKSASLHKQSMVFDISKYHNNYLTSSVYMVKISMGNENYYTKFVYIR